MSQKTLSGLCILWGITAESTTLTPAPGRARQSPLFRANSVSDGKGGEKGGGQQIQMYFTRPQFPQQQQLGLFFPALFEFDFGFMCDLGDGRLASDALIVNLSPNSNPDIYHGLISVQIRVQQN